MSVQDPHRATGPAREPGPGLSPRRRRRHPITWIAAIAAPVIAAGSLLAGSLATGGSHSGPRATLSSSTPAAASSASFWSTQLDFDNNGTAWSEASFAALKADGLTAAEIDLPWNTIEPSQG